LYSLHSLPSSLLSDILRPAPLSTLFPYTTLFRSRVARHPHLRDLPGPPAPGSGLRSADVQAQVRPPRRQSPRPERADRQGRDHRSEEHTSELQSHLNLVCRLLLEKKKRTGTRNEA